ncbi:AraC family transcriptional regulator [Paenibacillus segetis]|uniref:HTH-type transcriptional regulator YfiF n=1 Tax=Paenibacillus segetis TaxID=1325360 RepID=A0ABQ1YU71_9BACL|nr:AraC family transcriptional regulator [Paenibacillus segetis]GGH36262.1 putative HTH-type transcriptional regulator YfiF [Paenibacillus segetis]
MLDQDFRRANALLNQHITQIAGEQVSFRIHYWGFMPSHYNNSLHRHSFFEICYVLEGCGEYSDNGVDYLLQEGILFCSRPGIWHQIRSEQGLTLFFVAFEIDESRTSENYSRNFRSLIHRGKIVAESKDASISAQIWQTIFSMAESKHPISKDMLQHLVLSLLLSFLHGFSPLPDSSVNSLDEDTAEHRLLKRAKLYIEDNLSSPLRIEHVSQELGISSRHLSRLFHSQLGQTFVHYVQEHRVQRAKEWLLNSDIAIKDIAKRAGFDSVHYFTRVFTKMLGVAPAKFRKSQFADGRQDRIQT